MPITYARLLRMKFTLEQFEQLKASPIFKGTIMSGSMEPLIKIGDEIIISVGDTNLKRYDIIVFYQDGLLICHFLWNINKIVEPKLLQTRNLAKFGIDYPITMNAYLGKVVNYKLRFRDKLRLVLHLLKK